MENHDLNQNDTPQQETNQNEAPQNQVTSPNNVQLNSITKTFTVNSELGPFLLSQTNGVSERFVDIMNGGTSTISLYSTQNGNILPNSTVDIMPGGYLVSYISAPSANAVYFSCSGGENPASITFTFSVR